MGWNNPPARWPDLEQAPAGKPHVPDGGDGPGWSRRRDRYEAPADSGIKVDELGSTRSRVPYVELHCHSNFSFLDGASHPEELVETAQQLELDGIALTDHDGMYGVVRFAEAARELGVRTVFGTELSLGLSAPGNGAPDPGGEHLLLLATDRDGYHALCRTITSGQLGPGSGKGRPVYDLEQVVADTRDECVVLTGCRKGAVRRALDRDGPDAAFVQVRRLVDLYGEDRVFVELTDHGHPEDGPRNDLLWDMARDLGLPTVATNAAHYAVPGRGRLAATMAAVRARRSLDEMTGWLPPGRTAFLRSGEDMARRFARFPGAVHRSAVLGMQCQFDLKLIAPRLPPFDVPPGHDENSHLRELTYAGAAKRYRSIGENPRAYEQIEHELKIIEELGFPGYFLVVHDIVDFCRRNGILCQGRGSAANSAVCYALGITNVDAVRFERLVGRAPGVEGGHRAKLLR
ncbi:PHP domain-containing protein, partial [Saccharothrix longispora]|uniref:PHP domain-containing protein n=1 Tax=Saccharothrix longispora TaxID=33920 RepID=UPI0028FD1914